MSEQAALPKDYPIMRAWEAYEATAEYANTERWARVEEHTKGSLWAAFVMGYSYGVIPGANRIGHGSGRSVMSFPIHIPVGPLEYIGLGLLAGLVIGFGIFLWLMKDFAVWR